jgi:hypothetical protein
MVNRRSALLAEAVAIPFMTAQLFEVLTIPGARAFTPSKALYPPVQKSITHWPDRAFPRQGRNASARRPKARSFLRAYHSLRPWERRHRRAFAPGSAARMRLRPLPVPSDGCPMRRDPKLRD